MPQSKYLKRSSTGTVYSPRVSKWLGHGHLATTEDNGSSIHWKTQYRLRHNWSRGICRLDELEVSRPPLPQILVKLYSGIVVTADREHGLRAWATKALQKELNKLPFPNKDDSPTALDVTENSFAADGPTVEVTVGFDDGHFNIYTFDVSRGVFALRHSQNTGHNASITALASAPPYLLTLSDHTVFNLYQIPARLTSPKDSSQPRLLASLESNNTFAPMSLSLRLSASEVIASIAYSFFHISNGWTIGIQELQFTKEGEHLTSRLATTIAGQPKTSRTSYHESRHPVDDGGGNIHSSKISPRREASRLASSTSSVQHKEAPTSLSYSHPFLLTSHSDNTLTMYLVFSSADKLVIRDSRRLWGHTSAVSNVQVGERGKAVSVSPRGNEIRIWELESAVSSFSASVNSPSSPVQSRNRTLKGDSSVRIHHDQSSAASLHSIYGAKDWSLLASSQDEAEPVPSQSRHPDGWVGFDEEQVVVLRQRGVRAQFLERYDFT